MTSAPNGEMIKELLQRGVEAVYPNEDFLKRRLLSGEKLKVYLGIDPTGPTLHLGHVIALKKLRSFQDLGHEATLLIGDFTATIGDPTDKTSARKELSKEEVGLNERLYKEQAGKVLSFEGGNPASLRHNSEWFEKMSFADTLKLSSYLTYSQIIKRGMFQERIAEEKDLYIHEFLYPLMQGYDSVAMDVDGEVGGNDQAFNMLVGRDLMKRMKGKEKFVIAIKLLEDSSGRKMGKTEGNMVSLSDFPSDMFGKIMSWSDDLIMPGFELVSTVPYEELSFIEKELREGASPKDLKARLAENLVSMVHGPDKARAAATNFSEVFSGVKMPEDAASISLPSGATVAEFADELVKNGIVGSKSAFRRLLDDGAVRTLSDEKISPEHVFKNDVDLKVGKRRFVKVGVRK